MFGEVQTHGFDFFVRTQSDDRLYDEGDYQGADNGKDQRHEDRLDLLEDERLGGRVGDVGLQIGDQVRVRAVAGQNAGHERAERATHRVHAEGVKRVVVTENRFDFRAEEERHQASEDA